MAFLISMNSYLLKISMPNETQRSLNMNLSFLQFVWVTRFIDIFTYTKLVLMIVKSL